MQRPIFLFALLALMLTACAPPQGQANQAEAALPLTDCALVTSRGQQISARCGTLNIPEDRANPNGRQIPVHVAVIPAVSRAPQPDPLFLLAGGPGQAASEAFVSMLPMLKSISQERDIVLVDQRGTGKSNPLRCLDPQDESLDEQEMLEKLKACPAQLDAHPRFYTTEIAMTDLDEVRAALGYESINLYGASYGTRAALTYLRMFPGRVRTVTLDAVVDAEFILFMDAARDGQAALDKFFARCQNEEACQAKFPNLESEFVALLKRLEQAPAEITLAHPVNNQPVELTVTRKMVTNLVFSTLYVPDLVATLPLSIHEAYTNENYVPLVSQAMMLNAGLYDGMFYATACTEDAPLIFEQEALSRSANSLFGDRTADFAAVCAAWPKGQVSPDFRNPVQSDVPVLILSGEADPITPPRHAENAAKTLSNSIHIIFKDMGHGSLTSLCGSNLLKSFIENASPAGLDTSCAKNTQSPPFFVDFSGPLP